MMKYILITVAVFCCTGMQGQGLLAEYFNGIELKNLVTSRREKTPYLDEYLKSPAPKVNREYYSVRWSGQVYAPVTGDYKLVLQADDGIRLWIDDKLVIDEWREQEATTFEATVNFQEKTFHDIRIEYFNTILHAVMKLSWENPGDEYVYLGSKVIRPRVSIPPRYLRPTSGREPLRPAGAVVVGGDEQKQIAQPKKQITTSKASTTIKRDIAVTLRSIQFEQTKSNLPDTSYQELDQIAEYLSNNPALTIEIIGHTDYAGDSLSNHVLSMERAQAVADYLIRRRVSNSRIHVRAMGSLQPIVRNKLISERRANRRVEFIIKEK